MRALVTGAGGFLGGAIARRLLAKGYAVRSLARQDYPALREMGIETVQGNLTNPQAVDVALEGCNIVFHVAAKAGVWGPYAEYYQTNVVGTRNIIDGCLRKGVRHLVYTSSPSVTFAGQDQDGVNESEPYPRHFLAHYPRTKAEAEQLVIKANGDELKTVSLRPHLIWGPGDNHLVPRIIERGRAGKIRLLDGGTKQVDSVYVDNATEAHIQAGECLLNEETASRVTGKAYFISNGEPLPLADLINRILAAGGLPPVTRTLSSRTAYIVGALLEGTYALLHRRDEPIMTRFVARQLSTSHWFDLSAARRDFAYAPAISIEEGMKRLTEWLKNETSTHSNDAEPVPPLVTLNRR